MSDISTTKATEPHHAIAMLLPWYANGRLSTDETTEVEQHLADCPTCRAELAQCRTLAQALQHDKGEGWQPSPGSFDRLLAQIEQLESSPTPIQVHPPSVADSPPVKPQPTRSGTSQSHRLTLWERLSDWLGSTPSPIRWTLALESVAVAALLLLTLLPGRLPTGSEYETLSNADQPASLTTGPRLRIIFNETATAGDMLKLLREIDGEIIAGPTTLGVYTVALADGSVGGQKLADVLNQLRTRPQVRLVEPHTQGDRP